MITATLSIRRNGIFVLYLASFMRLKFEEILCI